jgi:hypothetical protein
MIIQWKGDMVWNKLLKNRDDLNHLILLILILLFFLIISLIYKNRERKLSNNFRYTVGITKEIKRPHISKDYILYIIDVNGKSYTGSLLDMANVQVPGGEYIVKYDISNPKNSRLLKDYKLKDTVFEIPSCGWSELPMQLIIRE